jgi:hypothetical protein
VKRTRAEVAAVKETIVVVVIVTFRFKYYYNIMNTHYRVEVELNDSFGVLT